MVPSKIRAVIKKFKSELKKDGFPPFRFRLFGSYARNENHKDSDIDICILSTEFGRKKESYRKIAILAAFRVDPRIQIVLADPKDIKSGVLSPLYNAIDKESVAA